MRQRLFSGSLLHPLLKPSYIAKRGPQLQVSLLSLARRDVQRVYAVNIGIVAFRTLLLIRAD